MHIIGVGLGFLPIGCATGDRCSESNADGKKFHYYELGFLKIYRSMNDDSCRAYSMSLKVVCPIVKL